MAVVKEVCSESMLGAQEEAKNRPGYHANGEVTNVDLDEITISSSQQFGHFVMTIMRTVVVIMGFAKASIFRLE